MMWGYGFGWGWFMMMFGGLLWLAILAILVWALIRWFERKAPVSGPSTPTSPSALEILRQRYARGEIDTATYEQMRERLQVTEHGLDARQRMPESTQSRF
jgi:putative membrane protein